MNMLQTSLFDPSVYLDTQEGVTEYMAAALETKDRAVIAAALAVVAKARGGLPPGDSARAWDE